MSVWIMPLIALAPPRTKVAQFTLTIKLGGRYLQPASRILPLCLATLLYLSWGKNWQCILHALAVAALVPIAPYENYFIFPVNDRVVELGRCMKKLERDDGEENGKEAELVGIDRELRVLLVKWQYMNLGRAGPSLVAAVLVGIAGMLGSK